VASAPGAAEQLNGNRKLSVLVVDDHAVVQWGFRLLLGRQPWMGECAVASNTEEAVELARQGTPDVALVDLFLGERSGAELCEALREVSPKTRVLLISGAGWISPEAAKAAGASGFVSKDWSADEVANAVRMVGRGMTVFARQAEGPATPLSPREREVLELIGAGKTNREIAERLFLSPHTIKDHTTALYRKLGVRNRAEAARKAEQLGLGSGRR
jgi:two-component system response regulator DesR